MATLIELRGLFENDTLLGRVGSALLIAVQAVLDGTPTIDDKRYASHVFNNPDAEAKKALMSVLASNSTASVAAITGATDTVIKNNVSSVVATLSDAWNAAN